VETPEREGGDTGEGGEETLGGGGEDTRGEGEETPGGGGGDTRGRGMAVELTVLDYQSDWWY